MSEGGILIKCYNFRKPNIFDNMIAMMEKYANNLEALVDERTDQLQEEKKKTGKNLEYKVHTYS